MEKKWIVKPLQQTTEIDALAQQLTIEKPLAALLLNRGITTAEEAKDFFEPDITKLHDPFLMLDMDKAVERISHAIIHNEKILVYGDYDVDGTTAVALLYSFLKEIIGQDYRQTLEYYIPDRYDEGYGISIKGIEYCKEKGVNLLISLDCGIKGNAPIDLANQYGVDVIVCDHHLEGESLPKAVAVLDPKRKGCPYPFKELSGCGVGLKLIHAYCIRYGLPDDLWLSQLDLVAISIASDIVDITGENRIITHFGLEIINTFPRMGLRSIIEQSGYKVQTPPKPNTIYDRELTVTDIVFYIGPRINAAGRMTTGRSSVHLFICEDEDRSSEIGKNINAQNDNRKDQDREATLEAVSNVGRALIAKNRKSLVVYNPAWSKGIIGIVASRLVEEFYRPTVVLTKATDGLLTGSARSVKEFNIYEAIDSCSHLLEHFGGHNYAAGLSLKEENLQAFVNYLENYTIKHTGTENFSPEIEIDMELDLKDITKNFVAQLKKFAPFGPGNMTPVFISKNVVEEGFAKIVGEKHLKIKVLYRDRAVKPIEAIAFNKKQYFQYIKAKNDFHIVYHIEENTWNNNTNIQLNVIDIKTEKFNSLGGEK
ncbi:MAG: single-stranded-DNA-specific exonuclease RecJ [Bacteroidales bacterium]|jgi:single-stranded-DNA-specific exonuclease|nr:single-stranded-DNA-specific exonuclease RecJ [Bacteroidales bacterium]